MGSQGTPKYAVNGNTRGSHRQPVVTSTNELLKDDTQRTVFPVISIENGNTTLALKVYGVWEFQRAGLAWCAGRVSEIGDGGKASCWMYYDCPFLGTEYAV